GTCATTKKCKVDGDCVNGDGCQKGTNVCIAMCSDQHVNGMETDIDCGGNTACVRCPSGLRCQLDTDCVTGDGCLTGGNTCIGACSDGHVDGVETDIDCGGANSCSRCNTGLKCKVDTDCVTGDGCLTGGNTCVILCKDGHKDGNETDIDC